MNLYKNIKNYNEIEIVPDNFWDTLEKSKLTKYYDGIFAYEKCILINYYYINNNYWKLKNELKNKINVLENSLILMIISPDCPTFSNPRHELLNELDLSKEMHLNFVCLRNNKKCSNLWYLRKTILKKLFKEDNLNDLINNELFYLKEIYKRYDKSYYFWNYYLFITKLIKSSDFIELKTKLKWYKILKENVIKLINKMNHSIFHFNYILYNEIYKILDINEKEEFKKNELKFLNEYFDYFKRLNLIEKDDSIKKFIDLIK